MSPELLEGALHDNEYAACLPGDIYGQCADYTQIEPLCAAHGVPIIEDAAEALGARYAGKPAGSFGGCAALSFNGSKIVITSGGGALVTDNRESARNGPVF